MPERVNIPVRGATDTARFRELPAGFVPLDNIRNVRVFTPRGGVPQIGTRPGVAEVFTNLGSSMVQGMCVLNRASLSAGFTLGDPEDAGDGISRAGVGASGNLWVIDDNPTPSILYNYTLDTVVPTAAPYPNVTAVAFSPDGTLLIAAHSERNVHGKYMVRLRCLTAATGALNWTASYNDDGSTDDYTVYAGCIACSRDFVFVGAKASLIAVRLSGTNAGRVYDCGTLNGWASEIAAVGVWLPSFGGNGFVYAAFQGTTAGNQTDFVGGGSFNGSPLVDDDIDAGITASHFRAGVMKWGIYDADGSGGSIYPVHRVTYGTQFTSLTSPGVEYGANHLYYRIWEQSIQKPHGCYITDMAVGTDGSVVLTRTNQGWGPNATPWRPGATGGSYSPLVPDVTITKIDPNGLTQWEIDPGSNHDNGNGSGFDGSTQHFNDINHPTFRAVAMDANGAVYAAGYQNPSGYSVVRLSSDGGIDWRQNVVPAGSAVSISAITVDPTDGNLIVATPWNAGWSGATENAHLFKLSANDGRIIWAFSVASTGAQGLAVAVSPTGRIAFGTDYVG